MVKITDNPVSPGVIPKADYGSTLVECVSNYLERAELTSNSVHSDRFKLDYLRTKLLSKYLPSNEVILGSPQHDAALRTHYESEERCRVLNEGGIAISSIILALARKYIRDVIGSAPDLSEVYKHCRFSGGASTQHGRPLTDPFYKHASSTFDVTPRCAKYFLAAYGEVELNYIHGNRVGFVPKNSETYRTTASEPTGNMFVQLGIGSYIRSRLKRVPINYMGMRIDVRDQTNNQELARIGSITNKFATLDCKNASSTISRMLVLQLLPPDWYTLLDDVRSHYYTLNKDVFKWENFSSMGNGFTFELETLIFWALTRAACVSTSSWKLSSNVVVAVYGDDIICEGIYSPIVIETLERSGFVINKDKSFTDGPFRESCGYHFHDGLDVTPFYIKGPINDIERHNWLLNRIRRWSYCNLTGVCDPRYYNLWLQIYKMHPLRNKLSGGSLLLDDTQICSPGVSKFRLKRVTYVYPVDGQNAVNYVLSSGYATLDGVNWWTNCREDIPPDNYTYLAFDNGKRVYDLIKAKHEARCAYLYSDEISMSNT